MGDGGMEVGEKTVTTKMTPALKQAAPNESHFNVLLIARDKVTRQCPQTTTFEEKGEPKRIRTEVPLLKRLTARPNRLTEWSVHSLILNVQRMSDEVGSVES